MVRGNRKPRFALSADGHYNNVEPVVNVGCFQRRWDVIGKIRSYDNDSRASIIRSFLPVCLLIYLSDCLSAGVLLEQPDTPRNLLD